RPDDVLRGAEAAQRIGARDLLQRLVVELRALLALPDRALAARLGRARGEAGADGVERDAVLAHLLGDRLRHRDHARLGAGVDRLAPLADAPGVGRDRDDPARPALDHVVEHRPGRVDEAPHVDGDLALPLLARLLDEQAVDGP